MPKGWGSRFWYERIGVRGFGAGVDWGSRFWPWGGLGFEVFGVSRLGFKVLVCLRGHWERLKNQKIIR